MSILFGGRKSGGARVGKSPSVKQRVHTFFINHVRQALASLGEISGNWLASAMTIAVLGLSLTLPSTFYILVKNTEHMTQQWQQASEITLYLKEGATQGDIQQLIKRVQLWHEVQDISYTSADDALIAFKASSGLGDVLDYLDDNPLPDAVMVTPQTKHMTPTAAQLLLNKLVQEREVEYGQLDIEWLKRLQGLLAVAKDLTLAIAIVLFLAVVLIVGNTIRLDILNKRSEILIMKLVGATDGFIQRPFLYTGFWFGVLGGLCAWVCVGVLLWSTQHSLDNLGQHYQQTLYISGIQLSELLVILGTSVLLGLAGSYVAVTRHIKEIEPK